MTERQAPYTVPNDEGETELLTRASLANLRRELAETRAKLRTETAQLEVLKARIVQGIVDEAGGDKQLGPNEAARERAITLALAESPEWNQAASYHRYLVNHADRLEAEINARLDATRDREWAIRDKIADALLAALLPTEPKTSEVETDAVTDALVDDIAIFETIRAAGSGTPSEPW